MKGFAKVCVILMLWTIAPWQWMCIGHDHSHSSLSTEIHHQENSSAFHGCDIEFFSPFHESSQPLFIQDIPASSYLVLNTLSGPLTSVQKSKGRSPPAYLFAV